MAEGFNASGFNAVVEGLDPGFRRRNLGVSPNTVSKLPNFAQAGLGGLGNALNGASQGPIPVADPNKGVLPPSGMIFTGGRPFKPSSKAADIAAIGGFVKGVVQLIATQGASGAMGGGGAGGMMGGMGG